MDKKSETRLKRKQFRLKCGIFLRKNGLFAALAVCLAVIGVVAAVVFSGGSGSPVEHNYDERLHEAVKKSESPTEPPVAIVLPGDTTHTEEAGRTAGMQPKRTPLPTLQPDFTPAPSASPEPSVLPVVLNYPVEGEVVRIYAMDCLIYSKTLDQWMTHPGVDVAAPKGKEVRCVAAGSVERVYKDDMLGVTVVISHENGMRSVYSNLKEQPPVSEGQRVESRAVIGYVGDTAISECSEQSHLHFELYINDSRVDPAKYVTFPSLPD